MEIIFDTFKDKKERYNAMANSEPMQKYKGNVLTVTGVIAYSTIEKDKEGKEEVKTVTAFKTDSGEYIGTVSDNILEQFEMVLDGGLSTLTADDPLTIRIDMKKSKNDRDFLTFTVL